MSQVDTLIHARWIIPVEPNDKIFQDHTLVIDQQRIVAIVPQAEAQATYTAKEEINCEQHALIPGLVNAHTHLSMNLLRGLADDLPLMTWLNDHIWPKEKAWVGPEFVRDGSKLAIAEMIKGGVTCFNDMYFFPESIKNIVMRI